MKFYMIMFHQQRNNYHYQYEYNPLNRLRRSGSYSMNRIFYSDKYSSKSLIVYSAIVIILLFSTMISTVIRVSAWPTPTSNIYQLPTILHPFNKMSSSSSISLMNTNYIRRRGQQLQQPQQYKTKLYDQSTTDEQTTATAIEIERPDPSILLSSQTDTIQQVGFISIWIALGLGTVTIIQLLTILEQILPNGWYAAWRDYTWPIPFGLIFIAAGIAHFTMKDTFCAMVPPKGTWGNLWNIPAPYSEQLQLSYEEYHVYWSGIAEMGGGLLLILAFILPDHILSISIPSSLLFLLLLCVTPANIYMATHDIQPPGLPPIPYPVGHIGRGILQCILLAMFWKLTFQ